MLSSYDYLGLAEHPRIRAASAEAVHRFGTGTGGVRLLTGSNELHRELEEAVAAFLGCEGAVLFSSGYLANLGAISALAEPQDVVVMDERAHQSLTDACRLARVPVRRFRHNDMEHLEYQLRGLGGRGRVFIIVEGAYSMDGDLCPLPDIVALKEKYGAYLLVDEAHSLGVFGERGRGVVEHYDVDPDAVDVRTGALSKAIPSNGGFVAGRRGLTIYLQHGAAPFMFSAALAPASTAAAREAFRVLGEEPKRLQRLRQNASHLRRGLQEIGYDTGTTDGPIIPVIVGEDEQAYRLARRLLDEGVLATAVVFPAVPRGSARLRLCATASHDGAIIEEALKAFRKVADTSYRSTGDGAAMPDSPVFNEAHR